MMTDYDVYDHRDLLATCLDIDVTSQYLALAGKRYLAITSAVDPENCDIKYARRSRWEAGCVRWCNNKNNSRYLALTSSQSFELYVFEPGAGSGLSLISTVRAHGRIVTDLDWDNHEDGNRFATCAVDDNAHIWDLRDLKKPSLTLNIIAGANQIKWAKELSNICATAHDGDIRIWDVRKGTCPVQYISAHLAKVHALDWHPKNDVQFVSSGQDCSLKLWDFTKPSKPEVQCNLLTPVWKAKFAPFQNGLLTIPTPHVGHTERALTLWNCQDFSSAVHNFLGHSDLILDFCWRKPSDESEDFVQIISLSKDCTVRVWTLDSRIQEVCDNLRQSQTTNGGVNSGGRLMVDDDQLEEEEDDQETIVEEDGRGGHSPHSSSPFMVKTTRTRQIREDDGDGQRQQPLDFNPNKSNENISKHHLVNVPPSVTIEEASRDRRVLVACVRHHAHVIRLVIYLSSIASSTQSSSRSHLSFHFSRDTSISNNLKVAIIKRLQEVCEKQELGDQQAELEACLRRLPEIVGEMMGVEQQAANVENSVILQSQIMTPPNILASFLDARVPFPRTTGAQFNSVGILVCFRRTESVGGGEGGGGTGGAGAAGAGGGGGEHAASAAVAPATLTPRSYSALANFARESRNYFSMKTAADYRLKSYYQKVWRPARKNLLSPSVKLHPRGEPFVEEVGSELALYDASAMMPIHKELAKTYCYPENESDLVNVCLKNGGAAAAVGRKDLVQAWTLLSQILSPALRGPFDEFDIPWATHPFGRTLVTSLIDHLAKIGDVQSAAMICCVLDKRPRYHHNHQSYQLLDRQCTSNTTGRLLTTGESASGGSPYNTVHSSDGIYEMWTGYLMRQRTGSCSEQESAFSEHGTTKSLDQFTSAAAAAASSIHPDTAMAKLLVPTALTEEECHERNAKLLVPDLIDRFEALKQAYADILFRWGMLNERAAILKYSHAPPERYYGMEFVVQCRTCGADCRSPICADCRKYAMICSVCQMAVKGLCCVCSVCGHGGHTIHMAKWFETQKKCPSGCGCACLIG